MIRKMTEVRKLKEGRFIMIDNEPCRIVGFSTPPLGKHGHENARIAAVGLFDSQRRSIIKPASSKIEVPIIERGIARVIAIVANTAQLMNLTTYETFELPISLNLRGDVCEGGEVEYIQVLGRRKIERVK
jgi:translation initiation factor 5A